MHKHNYWEIVIILDGSGVYTVGDEAIHFKPKTIICQPPNAHHGAKVKGAYRDIYIGVKDFIPLPFGEVPVFADDEEDRFLTLAKILHSTLHKKRTQLYADGAGHLSFDVSDVDWLE